MGDPFDFNDKNPDGPEIGQAPDLEETPDTLEDGLFIFPRVTTRFKRSFRTATLYRRVLNILFQLEL